MDNEFEVNEQELEREAMPSEPQPEEEQVEAVQTESVPAEVVEEAVQPDTAAEKKSPFADSPYELNWQPRSAAKEAPVVPAAEPKQAAPKKQGLGMRIVAALLAVVIVAASSGITAFFVSNGWKTKTDRLEKSVVALQDKIKDLQQEIRDNSFTGNGNSVSGTPNTSADGLTPGQVYAQNYKSVVMVHCQDTGYFGTGFIISENGYTVTNYHVVEGSEDLAIVTFDGEMISASVVGYDAANDFAVLKADATGLDPVTLGSSDDLIVGDQVAVIGHPLGIETAVLTVGYISAKDQLTAVENIGIINMLQTDAATNSGNSGGPLFNMKGELVGIMTSKHTGPTNTGSYIEGTSFAIPIDDVVKKIHDLMDLGYISGAYLGVYVKEVNPEVLDAFGFPKGVYVDDVEPGYCAAKAGIRAKDMIIAIGEYKVDSMSGLSRALQKFKPGDKTTITVWRAGAELKLDITLDAKPRPTP